MKLAGSLAWMICLWAGPLLAAPEDEDPTGAPASQAAARPEPSRIERPLYLGALAGESSGLLLGYRFDPGRSLEGRAEFGLFPAQTLALSVRYWATFGILSRGPRLPLSVGLGARAGLALDDAAPIFGLLAPVRLGIPLGGRTHLFGELSPGLLFLDGPQLDLDTSLGLSFYF